MINRLSDCLSTEYFFIYNDLSFISNLTRPLQLRILNDEVHLTSAVQQSS